MLNYKLLTPGPLTTSATVKEAMLFDHCTWDDEYKTITQNIRQKLLQLAAVNPNEYTTILMQGSGSFGVESVVTTAIANTDKTLVLVNGEYGKRLLSMFERTGKNYIALSVDYHQIFNPLAVETILKENPDITHIAMVHCETTTGILNNIEDIASLCQQYKKIFIVDAMSSFAGMPIDISGMKIDYLISSSNKCIEGVPGFSFVIAKLERLKQCQHNANTVSLDLYAQWEEMNKGGKWRFTSPTHSVLAFAQALIELDEEGGIAARHQRYLSNNRLLRRSLNELGLKAYIDESLQSPIITTFIFPEDKQGQFIGLYNYVKQCGYAIYPGKLTEIDTFRLGNIGKIDQHDIEQVVLAIKTYFESK